MQPLVSIVTPSFNQAEFIADTIESVLAQDYPQIEYLVMDGGSTDGTLDLLRGYGARLRWVSARDGGQADALNRGFALTRGPLLTWLNADDRYLPGAVARMVAAIEADPPAALVYGRADFIDRAGARLGACPQVQPFDLHRLIHCLDYIVQPAAMFRRSAFAAVGGLDATLRYCLDYDLWIRLALRYPVRYLPETLAEARIYPATKTASGGLERLYEIERMSQRYGRRRLPRWFYREMVKTCLGSSLRALRGRRWRAALAPWRRGAWYGAALLLGSPGLE